MMLVDRRWPGSFVLLVGVVLLAADARPARAQWGPGMGVLGAGWGWGGFGSMPSPSTTLLNDHAIARMNVAAGRMPGRSHSAYGNNPNSYINRVRDNGFVSHWDVERRRPPSYRTAPPVSLDSSRRTAGRSSEPATAPAAAPAREVVPLGSFFDKMSQLVWPQESPLEGEFATKRRLTDEATLVVWDEVKRQGIASVDSVTEARARLIAYGKPALELLREHSTTPIADAFHRFLLSLYDSLADAAWTAPTGR